MNDVPGPGPASTTSRTAKDWAVILARYCQPNAARGAFEIAITLVPLIGLAGLAAWTMSTNLWLGLLLCVPAAGFLVRLFVIQHDCGHGAFFKSRRMNDWVGTALGVLTSTPHLIWKHSHTYHHSGSGNLDKRGMGAIHTLTVEEYLEKGWWNRLLYRLYRNPLILFFIGPPFVFLIQNRLPFEFFTRGLGFWASALGSNVAMILASLPLVWAFGWLPVLLVYAATTTLAAIVGVWLFYVQHQFEGTHWSRNGEWQMHDAALHGSSHYDLPTVLRWITGNIGIHHVHHLNSRIPLYRLWDTMRDHPELKSINRLTLWDSFRTVGLHLWDEANGRMVSFSEAKLA